MQSRRHLTGILARLLLFIVLLASGCAPAAATSVAGNPTLPPPAEASPTSAPPTATQEPSQTPIPPSPTPEPTATRQPTATASPTATPAPTLGPAAADSLTAWCMEEGLALSAISDPLQPNQTARLGTLVDGALELRNLPVGACVFIYTFNQDAPQGLKLQVFDALNKTPWLTADLIPLASQPQSAAATLTHTYIIAPPVWDISYQFAVVDTNGSELRRDQVNLHRWEPPICWNGQKPNVVTLRCPLQQDLHPWDPSYGTPFPTAVHDEDD